MNQDEQYQPDWEIAEAMICFGGGFVRLLGQLYRKGDLVDQRKIKNTFSEYWAEYTKFVEIKRAECKDRD